MSGPTRRSMVKGLLGIGAAAAAACVPAALKKPEPPKGEQVIGEGDIVVVSTRSNSRNVVTAYVRDPDGTLRACSRSENV